MLLVSWIQTNFGDRAFSAAGPESGTFCQWTSDSRTCIQPFQTVDEDVFIGQLDQFSVNPALTPLTYYEMTIK